jgi:hypothetical protein
MRVLSAFSDSFCPIDGFYIGRTADLHYLHAISIAEFDTARRFAAIASGDSGEDVMSFVGIEKESFLRIGCDFALHVPMNGEWIRFGDESSVGVPRL